MEGDTNQFLNELLKNSIMPYLTKGMTEYFSVKKNRDTFIQWLQGFDRSKDSNMPANTDLIDGDEFLKSLEGQMSAASRIAHIFNDIKTTWSLPENAPAILYKLKQEKPEDIEAFIKFNQKMYTETLERMQMTIRCHKLITDLDLRARHGGAYLKLILDFLTEISQRIAKERLMNIFCLIKKNTFFSKHAPSILEKINQEKIEDIQSFIQLHQEIYMEVLSRLDRVLDTCQNMTEEVKKCYGLSDGIEATKKIFEILTGGKWVRGGGGGGDGSSELQGHMDMLGRLTDLFNHIKNGPINNSKNYLDRLLKEDKEDLKLFASKYKELYEGALVRVGYDILHLEEMKSGGSYDNIVRDGVDYFRAIHSFLIGIHN